jgi:hypothetical protein
MTNVCCGVQFKPSPLSLLFIIINLFLDLPVSTEVASMRSWWKASASRPVNTQDLHIHIWIGAFICVWMLLFIVVFIKLVLKGVDKQIEKRKYVLKYWYFLKILTHHRRHQIHHHRHHHLSHHYLVHHYHEDGDDCWLAHSSSH